MLFGETAILADLTYLSWPKYPQWFLWLALSGVTATGLGSIVLRIMARLSPVRISLQFSTPNGQLIRFLDTSICSTLGAAGALVCYRGLPSDYSDRHGLDERTNHHR